MTSVKRQAHGQKEHNATGGKVVSRQVFPDILRVAAACAVVLLHTLTGAVDVVDMNQYPVEHKISLAVMDLITWCVPMFIMISGYLFLNPDRSFSFMQMLKKYCTRIVLALFLFGVPYALLELISAERCFRPVMLWQSVVLVLLGKSWAHMWYLYLILLLYLITPALKWILARMPKGCVYAIMAVILLGSSIFPFINKLLHTTMLPMLPEDGIYLFYYLCGYLFVCDMPEKPKVRAVRLIVIILLFAGMVWSRIIGDFELRMAYNYPFTVLVSVLIFGMAKNSRIEPEKKVVDLWQKASRLCFTIYLVHPVFVNVLYKLLHISLLEFPIGIALPVFFVVVLVMTTITAGILYKIPLLKKYVL